MDMLRILTKSGSRYEINDHGVCKKYNSEGEAVDAFKVFYMRPVPLGVQNMDEVYRLPESDPEIGKCLYIGGRDRWWLSTEVVEIDRSPRG